MQTDFDTVVVGAGVVGLAAARQLALSGQNVLVVEMAARAGTQTSSRNSEVVHAGLYYPTRSLKARLCVRGRNILYSFCASHGVEVKRIGKLIVATSNDEESKLQSIATLANCNGVDDLVWMSQADVAELEPEVTCTRALFSPSTGIVDASGFMLALQGEAEAHGASFAFNATFEKAAKQNDEFIVTVSHASGEISEFTAQSLINCAGHGAHDVAAKIMGFAHKKLPPRYFAKGNYCSVSGKSPFTHLIYPVPVAGALGVHATLDLDGAVRLGPDIQWVDAVDYSMTSELPKIFASAVQSYWPGVMNRALRPSYCGIRPKIHGPLDSFADFNIQQEAEHGIANLINLFGIESPGLTASMAIAEFLDHDENQRNSTPKL